MKVFLTGCEGKVGSYFAREFRRRGISHIGFDKKRGQDLRDSRQIVASMADCDTVMHLAVATEASGTERADLLGENLQGLFNLLRAAESKAVGKFVFMSSVDALGIFKGEAPPLYFPIDDEHPCIPKTEYGIGKILGERMCALWSERTGIPSIALRPPGIWFPDTYGLIERRRNEDPSFEWNPFWEYGAFIDAEDLFEVALKAAQKSQGETGATYLVAAADITTSGRSSLELATMLHPNVPWKDTEAYETDPFKSLLDCRRAMDELTWTPRRSWSGRT